MQRQARQIASAHCATGAGILAVVLFIAPRLLRQYDFMLASGSLPPFRLTVNLLGIIASCWPVAVSGILAGSFIDYRLCISLQKQKRFVTLTLWASGVTALLMGALVWLLWALSLPSIEVWQLRSGRTAEPSSLSLAAATITVAAVPLVSWALEAIITIRSMNRRVD